jgi:DNA-binding PadR family transcriptional regulator
MKPIALHPKYVMALRYFIRAKRTATEVERLGHYNYNTIRLTLWHLMRRGFLAADKEPGGRGQIRYRYRLTTQGRVALALHDPKWYNHPLP